MRYRITCTTRFDITATGIRHRHNRAAPKLTDSEIADEKTWHKRRNQQSNWETINQILALRTLPESVTDPQRDHELWRFIFEIPDISQTAVDQDPVGLIRRDMAQVPMIINLDETGDITAYLVAEGQDANIWFECEQLNTVHGENHNA